MAKHFINSIISTSKQNSNYTAAVNAVKNAYLNGAVVVGKALEYDGFGIGFPANLASDHVVFTVGAFDPISNQPFRFSGVPESDAVSYDANDINLIAPGVDLLTTLKGNQEYGKVSGTGASAALATGIISLLQAAEGDLTPDDIAYILETTALPLGGPGYDNSSGYGLIDAGAAMNYVAIHDIKHGTTTEGQVEKIASGRQITLFSSVWEELASGVYFADIYQVTYTIPLVPSADNDLWYNAKGTYGWSYANPNSQNRYAYVELFNDHATVTTYIYEILSNTAGEYLGWYPASPNNIQLSYSYVGEIPPEPPVSLTVNISGPSTLNSGKTGTWNAEVSNNEGPVSFQWYIRYPDKTIWHEFGTNSSISNYFNNYEVLNKEAGVKVTVTSAGETDTDVIEVAIFGYRDDGGGGGGCRSLATAKGDSLTVNRRPSTL